MRDALEDAERGDARPRVLCVGVAGVGRESERQALWEALTSQEIAEEVVVLRMEGTAGEVEHQVPLSLKRGAGFGSTKPRSRVKVDRAAL